MRPLTKQAKQEINTQERYQVCAHCKKSLVQIHHHILFQGHQIDDIFQLIALCKKCHVKVNYNKDIQHTCDCYCLQNATEEDMGKYPTVFEFLIRSKDVYESNS